MVRTRGGKTAPRHRSSRLREVTAEEDNSIAREPDPAAVVIEQGPEAEVVLHPKQKRKKRKRKTQEVEDIEEDREAVSGDDCEVVGDEDCEEVCYADGNHGEVREEGVGLEEVNCLDFEAEFGVDAREEDNGGDSDADSGDEIWDDERIPEPLSHSDDEDVPEEEEVLIT
ncbi:hypothetical protein AALP_AA4G151000 [Arabis alpina]|uniref:Uncharacterized protein n=1 Tax=Arabis alpina TaxID=50452 RepID=A0A087H3D7_ARAAL|nr:hypothetical protein AALP_AA4G151000 [Arabis alpina]